MPTAEVVTQAATQINWIAVGVIGTIVASVLGLLGGFLAGSIKIGIYKHKVDNLETRIKDCEKETREHSGKIIECVTKIEERTTAHSATALTKRKTPITLTEKGIDILKKSGSDKFVGDNRDTFVEKIREKAPKTAYDVQVIARQVIESIQNDEIFIPFKDYVFKEGIELESIFIVMSIYLRDIALPLLGFKYDEIDKTAPSVKS